MAVYKLFPESDSFIFTEEVQGNAGLDEIIEIGGYPVSDVGQTSRLLVKFNTEEIKEVIDNKVGSNNFSSSLHLYLASAYELPSSYSLNVYPVYDSYTNGTGKYGDIPVDKSGVSWAYKDGAAASTFWTLPSNQVNMPTYVTSSYTEGYEGGGSWYTGSAVFDLESSQSYNINSNHDIDINITSAVTLHYSESIDNNGYIVKLTDDLEFNATSSIRLKYYSADTHTIYPPSLDIKWDDSTYNTGDLGTLSTSICIVDITNNKGRYVNEGKQRFRLSARPQHPVRTFTTGSIYKTNYALPQDTYYGIRDEFTEEMVIPFDKEFTKVSCDNIGPFFDIYMEGLQPERYYRLLIKSILDGSTTVINTDNTFKVVRNG